MSAILFDAPCIRNGQPTTTEIVTSYTDGGHGLPILTILSNWSTRRREYDRKTTFRVEEVPTPDGRGFMLHRSEADVAKDGPDGDTFYGVLVARNGQDHQCTCRGFQAHGHCRHHDAVRQLLEAGHIDHPEADRPVEVRAVEAEPHVCPECGGELVVIEDDGEIVCTDCPVSYAMADDAPVAVEDMLVAPF